MSKHTTYRCDLCKQEVDGQSDLFRITNIHIEGSAALAWPPSACNVRISGQPNSKPEACGTCQEKLLPHLTIAFRNWLKEVSHE